jgi:hypothetical protein
MSILTPSNLEEVEELFAALMPALPKIVADAATGPGGLGKVVKVGGDLLSAAQSVQAALAQHPLVTAPAS